MSTNPAFTFYRLLLQFISFSTDTPDDEWQRCARAIWSVYENNRSAISLPDLTANRLWLWRHWLVSGRNAEATSYAEMLSITPSHCMVDLGSQMRNPKTRKLVLDWIGFCWRKDDALIHVRSLDDLGNGFQVVTLVTYGIDWKKNRSCRAEEAFDDIDELMMSWDKKIKQ